MDKSLKEIEKRLDRIEHFTIIGAKDVLDIEEAALFTGLSKGHLYRLTSQRQIPHYKKSRKLYFNKSELADWLLENKVQTIKDIELQSSAYILTHK